jgi:hypothetical protein
MFKKALLLFLSISVLVLIIGCTGNPITPPNDEITSDAEFAYIKEIGQNACTQFDEYATSLGEEEAYQATVAFLEQQDGVKEVGIGEDGTTIWYEYENGYLVAILSVEEEQNVIKEDLSLSFTSDKMTPSAEKALVLNPGFNPVGTYKAQTIKSKLKSLYGSCYYEAGSEVSIELMRQLYQYSAIYMVTHGGIANNKEHFALRIEVTTDIKDQYDACFQDQYLIVVYLKGDPKAYVGVNPSFIKDKNPGTFPDSLICMYACHSLENQTMAGAFKDKGAYAYCGYTTTMKFGYMDPGHLFANLIEEEMNVKQAIANIDDNHNFTYYPDKDPDHGNLYLISDNTPMPIIPTIIDFTINPSILNEGDSAILSWSVIDATHIAISPDIGSVGWSDSVTIYPSYTITYTLLATNYAGSATSTATVTVN